MTTKNQLYNFRMLVCQSINLFVVAYIQKAKLVSTKHSLTDEFKNIIHLYLLLLLYLFHAVDVGYIII